MKTTHHPVTAKHHIIALCVLCRLVLILIMICISSEFGSEFAGAATCSGDNWCLVKLPDEEIAVHAVWAFSSDDDVFAVGSKDGKTTILHFDGSSWSSMTHPNLPVNWARYGGTIQKTFTQVDIVLGLENMNTTPC